MELTVSMIKQEYLHFKQLAIGFDPYDKERLIELIIENLHGFKYGNTDADKNAFIKTTVEKLISDDPEAPVAKKNK